MEKPTASDSGRNSDFAGPVIKNDGKNTASTHSIASNRGIATSRLALRMACAFGSPCKKTIIIFLRGTTRDIFLILTSIDKRHNKRNERSRREYNTCYIKSRESKPDTATDTKGTDQESENKSQIRFSDIRNQKFLFQSSTMERLFFSVSNDPLSESRNNRIIFSQDIRRRNR